MPVAIGERYEVRFFCHAQEQLGINVRHFVVSDIIIGEGQSAEDIDLANAINAAFVTSYVDALSQHAMFLGTSVQLMQEPVDGPVVYSNLAPSPGLVEGDLAPTQLAGLIALRANLPGRRAYLRAYIPFPSASVIDPDGRPLEVYREWLDTIGENFVGPITTAPTVDRASFVLIGTAKTVGAGESGVLVASRARPGFATQRRRGYYGARNLDPFG